MHIILKNAQSMQSVDADAEWRPGQGLNHGNWQLAQIVHALLKVCTLICAKMHTDLCRNAENLSKCTTTLQHASGLGVEETQAWFRTENFWWMLKHRLHTELSHRSAHCCDYFSDEVTQTMLCSNQAGTLLPRKNQWTQYKNILPWKRTNGA